MLFAQLKPLSTHSCSKCNKTDLDGHKIEINLKHKQRKISQTSPVLGLDCFICRQDILLGYFCNFFFQLSVLNILFSCFFLITCQFCFF